MPEIRPSADLRNSYAEISDYCHATGKPVYITRNGRSDLVVLSSEVFDNVIVKQQEYCVIENGKAIPLDEEKLRRVITQSLFELQEGKSYPLSEGMAEARRRLRNV